MPAVALAIKRKGEAGCDYPGDCPRAWKPWWWLCTRWKRVWRREMVARARGRGGRGGHRWRGHGLQWLVLCASGAGKVQASTSAPMEDGGRCRDGENGMEQGGRLWWPDVVRGSGIH